MKYILFCLIISLFICCSDKISDVSEDKTDNSNIIPYEIVGKFEYGAASIYTEKDRAYLSKAGQCRIFNITNPLKPISISTFGTTASLLDGSVFISENIAYVGKDFEGLYFYDISNETNPVLVSSLYTSLDSTYWTSDLRDIYVEGKIVYLVDQFEGLMILNVQDIYNPNIISAIKPDSLTVSNNFFIKNNIVFVPFWHNNDGLRIYNVSNPSIPIEIGKFIVKKPQDIFVVDNIAYLTTFGEGLIVLDITDLSNPIVLSKYLERLYLSKIYVKDNLACIFADRGVVFLDISNITNIKEIFFMKDVDFDSFLGDALNDLKIIDSLIYVAGNDNSYIIKKRD